MGNSIVTQNRLKELFNYDSKTGIFTRKVRTSNFVQVGDVAGSKQNNGYLAFNIDGRKYLSHRLAWLYMEGIFPDGDVDHINGNRFDNRIKNLRVVSRSTNIQNQRKAHVLSKSGLLGVCMDSRGKRWIAQILSGGKHTWLGSYPTKELASQAYLKAKRKMHHGCTI